MSPAFSPTRHDPGRFIPKPDRPISAAYAKEHAKAIANFRHAFEAIWAAEALSSVPRSPSAG